MIVSHNPTFKALWAHLYDKNTEPVLNRMQCIKMPTWTITNELDKWILAALHEVGLELEKQMDAYALDG